MNPVHSLTIDVDVKSLLNVHMALIQNQPISTASAEDNNQRFSADNNNQDFPPSPLQGLLLPPWSWWQRLASRLSHLQLLLEKLWLKSTFWWNYLRKGSSYLRSWDSAAPHCWKVKMSRVQGCTQRLAKLCNRQATKGNTAALTCITNFLQKQSLLLPTCENWERYWECCWLPMCPLNLSPW